MPGCRGWLSAEVVRGRRDKEDRTDRASHGGRDALPEWQAQACVVHGVETAGEGRRETVQAGA